MEDTQVVLKAQNVVVTTDGLKLMIEIDLSKDCGRTSTDRSVMMAKTGGWQAFYVEGCRYKLNLNLIR